MKIKILLILVLTMLSVVPRLSAQDSITEEINYNQLEMFIQMAKEHYPQRKIMDEQEKQAKNNVLVSNLSYLDIINVSYYWRPEDRQVLNLENPYVTSGFQFGLSLSPSALISKPFHVKSARSNHKIAKLQKQAFDTELENQVKSLYYNYILQLKEFRLKSLEAQNAKGAFLELSNSFQRGEISMEEYDAGRATISNSAHTKLQSEINFLRARDELEAIIGVKLTDINK